MKKVYNRLTFLLSIVYIVHNAEEWLVFRRKADEILNHLPAFAKGFVAENSFLMTRTFGIAIVIATLIPLVISFFIWDKPVRLNLRILLVAGLVTLLNGLSHVISSVAIGMPSPGLFSGIVLCIPYGLFVFLFVNRNSELKKTEYISLGIITLMIFAVGLAFIWILSYLILLIL